MNAVIIILTLAAFYGLYLFVRIVFKLIDEWKELSKADRVLLFVLLVITYLTTFSAIQVANYIAENPF